VRYRVDQPIEKDAVTTFSDPADWPPAVPGGPEDNWGQDRELMRRGHFTGFPQHLTTEDLVIVTSQGPIVDRTREFLNSGDGALVRLRRLLLHAVGESMAGRPPSAAHHSIEYPRIRAAAAVIPAAQDWRSVFS
jgi:hypothetical protein